MFFTNINFTVGEKADFIQQARTKGFTTCEILDRERLRVALDSPDGFAARFQFLNIPMSESEQASFFAKWGDEIQSVIATGFQEVHSTLSQLLFLQEAGRPISGLHVQFKFDREYDASEIGHFRAFCSIYLREPKLGILGLLFGKADKAERFRADIKEKRDERPGIASGIASGQWKLPWGEILEREEPSDVNIDETTYVDADRHVPIGSGSGVGMKSIKDLVISYSTDSFIRVEPVLSVLDFDDCMLMPILNKSLAEKLERIRIFSNGYMLLDLEKNAFLIDSSKFALDLDSSFSEDELSDPWVRIRPTNISSSFNLSFMDNVPARIFKSKKLPLVDSSV